MSDDGAGSGKVLVHRTMSLDGFIAGPDHGMDWIFEHLTPDQFPEVITATGAILAGRRTYEVGRRDAGKVTGKAYGGAWSGAQFVLTHQAPDGLAESGVIFLSGDIGEAVQTALRAADGKNVEIFGADVARQCFERGLVDEILVHIVPVLLGAGTRFSSTTELATIALQQVSSTSSEALTTIRYRVSDSERTTQNQ